MICLPTRQTFCCAYIRQLLEMPSNTSKLFVGSLYLKQFGSDMLLVFIALAADALLTASKEQPKRSESEGVKIFTQNITQALPSSKLISQGRSYATRKLRSIMHDLESREVLFFAAASSSAILLKNCCLLFISRFQQILVSICVFIHVVHLELILVQFC